MSVLEFDGYAVEKRVLGTGSSGAVFKVKKTGKDFAIKRISDCVNKKTELLNFQLWKAFKSEFLVEFVESFRYCDFDLMVVMNWCPGDNLRDVMKKNPSGLGLTRVKKIFLQLLMGLNYLHTREVVHGNLKPENIFISGDDTAKIGDFGFERLIAISNQCKTMANRSPQYYSAESFINSLYNEKTDTWSLGIIVYEMITHELPFQGLPFSLPEGAVKKAYEPTLKSKCDDLDVCRMIYGMLEKDPHKRLTVSVMLRDPVVHSWPGAEKYFSSLSLSASPTLST